MSPRVAIALLVVVGLQAAALVTLSRPAPPINPALAAHWVSRLDTDGDGVLSNDEVRSSALPGLPEWDLDADGTVSPGELERMLWMLNPNLLYETTPARRQLTWRPAG
ncbi:MAG: hypothetical protein ACI8RZ_005937 [Myxococcota bacterium]|jgi:hypothetical protein